MSFLVTICARGGSKGIPGKNIKPLNGKPLITYTIDLALKFQAAYENVSVALSTDSDEIIEAAAFAGLKTMYRRPDILGGDAVGKIEVIKDVLHFYERQDRKHFEFVLDLDVTSPLRNLADLEQAFSIIKENLRALTLFSVSPCKRNPYFNMVEQNADGFYSVVKKPKDAILTRQATPSVYDLNASFYFYRRSFFEMDYPGVITDRSLVYIVPHLCFDLDHVIDFEFLSYLMVQNKLDFEL